MRGSVESPFEAQLHETVVIGLNTGVKVTFTIAIIVIIHQNTILPSP